MDASLIAPCGMNCALCIAHLRDKKQCDGCLGSDDNKSKSCISCVIKNCQKRVQNGWDHCYLCDTYPCARLKQLDKRYRTKYTMSMIENLAHIKASGMDSFLKQQSDRWTCKTCGGIVCVHRGHCLNCQ